MEERGARRSFFLSFFRFFSAFGQAVKKEREEEEKALLLSFCVDDER